MALLASISGAALAQQVTLTSPDENFTISGELISFENGTYVVRTAIGQIAVDDAKVTCEGPGCPGAETEDEAEAPLAVAGIGEPVELVTEDGGVRLEGTLAAFDGETYSVETAVGTFDISAEGIICTGPGCPQAPSEEPEKIIALIETEKMPETALLEDGPKTIQPLAPAEAAADNATNDGAPQVRVASLVGPYDLQFAGPGSVLSGVLPALADSLAETRGQTAELAPAELVSLPDAAAAQQPSGSVGVTLSDAEGSDQGRFLGRFTATGEQSRALLKSGDADIIFLSATPTFDDFDPAETLVLGVDGLVAIVSQDNPVDAVSTENLAAVFAGEIVNWVELGGPDLPIRVFALPDVNDTQRALVAQVLAPLGKVATPPSSTFSGADALAEAVMQEPGAIGFTSLGYTGGAKPLALISPCNIRTAPTPGMIKTRRYPLSRTIIARSGSSWGLAGEVLAQLGDDAGAIAGPAGLLRLDVERLSMDHDIADVRARMSDITDRFARLQAGNALRLMDSADRLSTVLYFKPGTNQLDARSETDLERFLDYADDTRPPEVFIVGYTGDTGAVDKNRDLSRAQAKLIRQRLETSDAGGALENSILRTIGLGAAVPVVCEDTPGAIATNNRVEIWVRR